MSTAWFFVFMWRFENDRQLYLKLYFYAKTNILKYKELLTSNSKTTLPKLSKFVDIIMKSLASYVFQRAKKGNYSN